MNNTKPIHESILTALEKCTSETVLVELVLIELLNLVITTTLPHNHAALIETMNKLRQRELSGHTAKLVKQATEKLIIEGQDADRRETMINIKYFFISESSNSTGVEHFINKWKHGLDTEFYKLNSFLKSSESLLPVAVIAGSKVIAVTCDVRGKHKITLKEFLTKMTTDTGRIIRGIIVREISPDFHGKSYDIVWFE